MENFICPRCKKDCDKYPEQKIELFRCFSCMTSHKNGSGTINFLIEFVNKKLFQLQILIEDKYLSISKEELKIFTSKFETICETKDNYLNQIDINDLCTSSEKLINKLLNLNQFS